MSDKLTNTLKWIGIVLIVLLLIVPWGAIYFLLKRNGKIIEFNPKFRIVDIKNEPIKDLNGNIITTSTIQEAVKVGNDILKKFKLK